MSNKGYRRHKCQKCGRLRSTQGMWCMSCIEAYLIEKKDANGNDKEASARQGA